MKRYSAPLGRQGEVTHAHPERTASYLGSDWDMVYQVWPNRASMAKTIRMQESRGAGPRDWRALVPLTPGEGY